MITRKKVAPLIGVVALLLPLASCDWGNDSEPIQETPESVTTTATNDSPDSQEAPDDAESEDAPTDTAPTTSETEEPGSDDMPPNVEDPMEDAPTDKPEPSPTNSKLTTDKPECYNQSFRDDFDTLTSEWEIYEGAGNAGNGIRTPDAVSVNDGILNIKASMTKDGIASGGMSAPVVQQHGIWTARVRIDADPTNASSGVFLLWPDGQTSGDNGETNIWETVSDNKNIEGEGDRKPVRAFVHHGDQSTQSFFAHPNSDGTQWATVSAELTPEKLTLYYNGEVTGTVTDPSKLPPTGLRATFQNDIWKDKMGAPVTMQIDWFEVHEYIC